MLKESLLHELAHWAQVYLNNSLDTRAMDDIGTGYHGDSWLEHVSRIRTVFGDFVGYRSLHSEQRVPWNGVPQNCGPAADVDTTVADAATGKGQGGGVGGGVRVILNSAIYTHVYKCGSCSHRLRYSTRTKQALKPCPACNQADMTYIGEVWFCFIALASGELL